MLCAGIFRSRAARLHGVVDVGRVCPRDESLSLGGGQVIGDKVVRVGNEHRRQIVRVGHQRIGVHSGAQQRQFGEHLSDGVQCGCVAIDGGDQRHVG